MGEFNIETKVTINNCDTCPFGVKMVPERDIPIQIYCIAAETKCKSHRPNMTRLAYGVGVPYNCPLKKKSREEIEEMIKGRVRIGSAW